LKLKKNTYLQANKENNEPSFESTPTRKLNEIGTLSQFKRSLLDCSAKDSLLRYGDENFEKTNADDLMLLKSGEVILPSKGLGVIQS
jgi:hypothetical protein